MDKDISRWIILLKCYFTSSRLYYKFAFSVFERINIAITHRVWKHILRGLDDLKCYVTRTAHRYTLKFMLHTQCVWPTPHEFLSCIGCAARRDWPKLDHCFSTGQFFFLRSDHYCVRTGHCIRYVNGNTTQHLIFILRICHNISLHFVVWKSNVAASEQRVIYPLWRDDIIVWITLVWTKEWTTFGGSMWSTLAGGSR